MTESKGKVTELGSVPEVIFEALKLGMRLVASVPEVMLFARMPELMRPPAMLSALLSYRLSLCDRV